MPTSTHKLSFLVLRQETIDNDLLLGKDVVVSFESLSNPLDIKVVKRLVKQIINSR